MSTFLPVAPSDPNNQFQVSLNDDVYTFDVRWNTRDEAWYFDLTDAEGRVIVAGVKIVLGALLGRRSSHPFFRQNVLVAIDTTLENRDPGFDDLGTRVLLKHMTAGEYISELLLV